MNFCVLGFVLVFFFVSIDILWILVIILFNFLVSAHQYEGLIQKISMKRKLQDHHHIEKTNRLFGEKSVAKLRYDDD